MSQHQLIKYLSSEVKVGSIVIGGKNPIRLQSMTNTNTLDTKASVEQCQRIFDAGADIVRLTAQGVKEAENLKVIRAELQKSNYYNPLVADIHFNPKAAEVAARYVEKVRINPGNYIDKKSDSIIKDLSDYEYNLELEKIHENILPLINICKENETAIRIGTNHGSLSNRIMNRYGDTPFGMANSAMEFLRVFEAENFHNIVLSMKSSNTRVMVYSTRMLVQMMQKENMFYPIHLGVTEAGEGEDGRIKSAVGIGTLLHDGIGDTIRVSLTEDPENEIPVARTLVDYFSYSDFQRFDLNVSTEYNKHQTKEIQGIGQNNITKVIGDVNTSVSPADLNEINSEEFEYAEIKNIASQKQKLEKSDKPLILKGIYNEGDKTKLQIKAACDLGAYLIDGYGDAVSIQNPDFDSTFLNQLSFSILQASRVRFTKTEYIACPGCGRTLYKLEETLNKIKEKTSHLKNLKIGVMGCIVNGPGEMADADYGYVGAGPGKITLYKNKEVIKRNVPEENAIDELIELIKENGDWK